MSSIMRRRSGEILSDESFMALLRLRNEADCLTSQHTKQNLRDQPPADPGSKPPLPRERFSPSTLYSRWRPAACGQRVEGRRMNSRRVIHHRLIEIYAAMGAVIGG